MNFQDLTSEVNVNVSSTATTKDKGNVATCNQVKFGRGILKSTQPTPKFWDQGLIIVILESTWKINFMTNKNLMYVSVNKIEKDTAYTKTQLQSKQI